MSKNAKQIVGTMLEDYGFAGGFGDEERAGGPRDMWRKGGYQKFDPATMDISGRRPGEPLELPEEEPEVSDEERARVDAANAAKALESKKKIQPGMGPPSRFRWTPPTP